MKSLTPLLLACLVGMATWTVAFLTMDLVGYAIFREIHHVGLIVGVYVSPVCGVVSGLLFYRWLRSQRKLDSRH